MSELFCRVQQTLDRYAMLPENGRIVLGLSGGADSMTLADFFVSSPALRPRLICAHVNHGIRGEEADRDEAFVTAWCRVRGVPCRVLHADIPAEAARTGESPEACGRRVRYAFFASLAAEEQARIAVAPNADDPTETILLHMVRGAGLTGLCGMAPVRGKIIRPLLFASRMEIEAHCRERGLAFVEDSTNASDAYTRNRLRHGVVPVLKDLNPNLNETLARMAASLAEDEACLQAQAAAALAGAGGEFPGTLRQAALQALPGPVLVRVLRRWVEACGLEVQEKHLRRAVECVARGGAFSPCRHWQFYCGQGAVVLVPPGDVRETVCPPLVGTCRLPDGSLWTAGEEFLENAHKIHNLLFKSTLDYDTMGHDLLLRHRRPGDVFCTPGRKPKPLKQLFSEARVPLPLRERLWVLESGGQVVWAEHFGAAAGYAAGADTRHILRVRLVRSAFCAAGENGHGCPGQ